MLCHLTFDASHCNGRGNGPELAGDFYLYRPDSYKPKRSIHLSEKKRSTKAHYAKGQCNAKPRKPWVKTNTCAVLRVTGCGEVMASQKHLDSFAALKRPTVLGACGVSLAASSTCAAWLRVAVCLLASDILPLLDYSFFSILTLPPWVFLTHIH